MSDCLRLWKLRTNWLNKIYIVLFAYFRVYCMFKPLFKTAKTVDQPLQILISRVPIHIPYMHANSVSERELSRSNQTYCTARLTATAKFTYPSRMTSTAEYRSRQDTKVRRQEYNQTIGGRIASTTLACYKCTLAPSIVLTRKMTDQARARIISSAISHIITGQRWSRFMFLKETESLIIKRSILVDPGKRLAVTCELNLTRHAQQKISTCL